MLLSISAILVFFSNIVVY